MSSDDRLENIRGKSYPSEKRAEAAWAYHLLLEQKRLDPLKSNGKKLVAEVAERLQVSPKFIFKYHNVFKEYAAKSMQANQPVSELGFLKYLQSDKDEEQQEGMNESSRDSQNNRVVVAPVEAKKRLGKFGSDSGWAAFCFFIKFIICEPRYNQYTAKDIKKLIMREALEESVDKPFTNVVHDVLHMVRTWNLLDSSNNQKRGTWGVQAVVYFTQAFQSLKGDSRDPSMEERLRRDMQIDWNYYDISDVPEVTDENIRKVSRAFAASKISDMDISHARSQVLGRDDIDKIFLNSELVSFLVNVQNLEKSFFAKYVTNVLAGLKRKHWETEEQDLGHNLEDIERELNGDNTGNAQNGTMIIHFMKEVFSKFMTKPITFKKQVTRFTEQVQERLQNATDNHLKLMKFVSAEKSTFVDEFSMVMNSSKPYGWNLEGQESVIEKPEQAEATTKVFAAMTFPQEGKYGSIQTQYFDGTKAAQADYNKSFFCRIFPPMPQRIKVFQQDLLAKFYPKNKTDTLENYKASFAMFLYLCEEQNVLNEPDTRRTMRKRLPDDVLVGDVVFKLRRRKDWLAPPGASTTLSKTCFTSLIHEAYEDSGRDSDFDTISRMIERIPSKMLTTHALFDPKWIDAAGSLVSIYGNDVSRPYTPTLPDIRLKHLLRGVLVKLALYDYLASELIWNHNAVNTIPAEFYTQTDANFLESGSIMMGGATQLSSLQTSNKLSTPWTTSETQGRRGINDFIGVDVRDELSAAHQLMTECFPTYTEEGITSSSKLFSIYPLPMTEGEATHKHFGTLAFIYVTLFGCDIVPKPTSRIRDHFDKGVDFQLEDTLLSRLFPLKAGFTPEQRSALYKRAFNTASFITACISNISPVRYFAGDTRLVDQFGYMFNEYSHLYDVKASELYSNQLKFESNTSPYIMEPSECGPASCVTLFSFMGLKPKRQSMSTSNFTNLSRVTSAMMIWKLVHVYRQKDASSISGMVRTFEDFGLDKSVVSEINAKHIEKLKEYAKRIDDTWVETSSINTFPKNFNEQLLRQNEKITKGNFHEVVYYNTPDTNREMCAKIASRLNQDVFGQISNRDISRVLLRRGGAMAGVGDVPCRAVKEFGARKFNNNNSVKCVELTFFQPETLYDPESEFFYLTNLNMDQPENQEMRTERLVTGPMEIADVIGSASPEEIERFRAWLKENTSPNSRLTIPSQQRVNDVSKLYDFVYARGEKLTPGYYREFIKMFGYDKNSTDISLATCWFNGEDGSYMYLGTNGSPEQLDLDRTILDLMVLTTPHADELPRSTFGGLYMVNGQSRLTEVRELVQTGLYFMYHPKKIEGAFLSRQLERLRSNIQFRYDVRKIVVVERDSDLEFSLFMSGKGLLGKSDNFTLPKIVRANNIPSQGFAEFDFENRRKEKDSAAKSFEVSKYLFREFMLALPPNFVVYRMPDSNSTPADLYDNTKVIIMDNSPLHWKPSSVEVAENKSREPEKMIFPDGEMSKVASDMRLKAKSIFQNLLGEKLESYKVGPLTFKEFSDKNQTRSMCLLFNPAYSPRLNAIELSFNVGKHYVKLFVARFKRTRKQLSGAILNALYYYVTDTAIKNFIRCAGYGVQSFPVTLPKSWRQHMKAQSARQCVGLRGDTWESLAKKHGITSEALKNFNNTKTNGISPGDIIYIPSENMITLHVNSIPQSLTTPEQRWDYVTKVANEYIKRPENKHLVQVDLTTEEIQEANKSIQDRPVEIRDKNMLVQIPIRTVKQYKSHPYMHGHNDKMFYRFSETRQPEKNDVIAVYPIVIGPNKEKYACLAKVTKITNNEIMHLEFQYLQNTTTKRLETLCLRIHSNAENPQGVSCEFSITTSGTGKTGFGNTMRPVVYEGDQALEFVNYGSQGIHQMVDARTKEPVGLGKNNADMKKQFWYERNKNEVVLKDVAWEYADNLNIKWLNRLYHIDKKGYMTMMFGGGQSS